MTYSTLYHLPIYGKGNLKDFVVFLVALESECFQIPRRVRKTEPPLLKLSTNLENKISIELVAIMRRYIYTH